VGINKCVRSTDRRERIRTYHLMPMLELGVDSTLDLTQAPKVTGLNTQLA
jgi:hypothetical protein